MMEWSNQQLGFMVHEVIQIPESHLCSLGFSPQAKIFRALFSRLETLTAGDWRDLSYHLGSAEVLVTFHSKELIRLIM